MLAVLDTIRRCLLRTMCMLTACVCTIKCGDEHVLDENALKEAATRDAVHELYEKVDICNELAYMTHFNGGCPYRVHITQHEIRVYAYAKDESKVNIIVDENIEYPFAYNVEVFRFQSEEGKRLTYWNGHDCDFSNSIKHRSINLGSSILIRTGKSIYVFIGDVIYSFETIDDEQIIYFSSPVGGNDVPYPFAIGSGHVYFLSNTKEYRPISWFRRNRVSPLNRKVWDEFYERDEFSMPLKNVIMMHRGMV
jgi:hypothetical protein